MKINNLQPETPQKDQHTTSICTIKVVLTKDRRNDTEPSFKMRQQVEINTDGNTRQGNSCDLVLLVLRDLRQDLLFKDGIILLQFDHGLLTKSINLVIVLLIQNWHSVQHHKDYI